MRRADLGLEGSRRGRVEGLLCVSVSSEVLEVGVMMRGLG